MPDIKRNKEKLKLLLLVAIIIALGIIIAAFAGYRRILSSPEPIRSPVQEGASISIANVHQIATRNGIKEWSLDAVSVYYMNSEKQAVLQELSVTFFLKNKKEVYLSAQKGILKTESNDIEVTGNVVLKDETYRLETETLDYEHGRRMFSSKTRAEITSPGLRLSADTMSADLNTGKTVFEGNVKGIISENISL
jgi:LPS export ABC transporter protein LptC